MSYFDRTKISDDNGNVIAGHQQTDGDYHLGVDLTQSVYPDTNNTSTTNLAAANDYTFVGKATSTLGVVGLQYNLATDQNATLYVEQSDGTIAGAGTVATAGTTTLTGTSTTFETDFIVGDEIFVSGETTRTIAGIDSDTSLTVTAAFDNTDSGLSYTYYPWDIVYDFDYIQSRGAIGATVQATASYWRLRVVLTGTVDTTYFRLSGVLCPIATPLPSRLSSDGKLQSTSTIVGKENLDRTVWVSPTNTLGTNTTVRLVGTNFDGATKDTNFWQEVPAPTGSGAVAQAGEIELSTGVTANSTVAYQSIRRARFVAGSALKWQGAFNFVTAGTTDNIRRMGAYDTTDGFFFQLDGSTFSVGTRKSSADTLVSSGSFNGTCGATFVPTADTYYKFEIEWGTLGTFFYVNGCLLHKVTGGHLSSLLSLPILFENNNDNGLEADVIFDCLGVVIMRLGQLKTNPIYKFINTNTTTICKYGAGILHTIINNENVGDFVVYDNTSAAVPIISSVDAAKVTGTLVFNVPFSNGLTIVTTGGATITVVYE